MFPMEGVSEKGSMQEVAQPQWWLSVNTMFPMEGVFEKGPMWEREMAKTNGVNEGLRMVVFMKEEACTY
jgi:hypothetical protein